MIDTLIVAYIISARFVGGGGGLDLSGRGVPISGNPFGSLDTKFVF